MPKFLPTRRMFLCGTGAVLAVPVLESLLPRAARAAAPGKALRFVGFFHPNGVNVDTWFPGQPGPLTLSRTLEPLAGVQDYVNVFSGLNISPDPASNVGSHEGGQKALLTAVQNGAVGDSIDQVIAQAVGTGTARPSLEIGLEDQFECNDAAHCHISFRGGTPLAAIYQPGPLFERAFGAGAGSGPVADPRRDRYRRSILDAVAADAKDIKGKLGKADKFKLDEYLTGVREIERAIEALQGGSAGCEPGAQPASRPADETEYADLMIDILARALQCGNTRVATFMMGRGVSDKTYSFLNVPETHHGGVSHHGGSAQKLEWQHIIDRWMVGRLARLCEALAGTPESGGTMLDNSVIFYSSDINNGELHAHYNMPVVLIGRGGGQFKTGRHIRYGSEGQGSWNDAETTGSLFLSILAAFGLAQAKFGDFGSRVLDLG
jgi:hypothetical protein